ncbi:methyltransferase domain-containing protein [bacterium]|nr:MAG: methyltransferase domain-containing protein [bacterium]
MNFDEIRKLASGYQPAKLLLTAVKVGLFETLSEGQKSAGEISSALGLDSRATEISANALVALGFIEKEGELYKNSESSARFFVKRSPDYKGAIMNHINAGWQDWADLEKTWRSGSAKCLRKEDVLPSDEEALSDFILGMENITREIAPKIAALLPLPDKKAVLDLGGGPGNYALAFAARAPGAKVFHFDLSRTSKVARKFVEGKPGAERVNFIEGDFGKDGLGGPYDLIFASQVLHMLGEAEVEKVITLCAGALSSGGVLAVHEHFLDDGKTSPLSSALFGVHMLAATCSGRSYSFAELENCMKVAGLVPTERITIPGSPSRLLLATK